MRLEGDAVLLRVFIGEADRWEGKPLYQAIVETARREGLAGATVLRGILGFGADSHIHTASILRLSEDLPIVVEIVDREEHIQRIMPVLDGMIQEGLVTTEKVHIVTYRAQGQ